MGLETARTIAELNQANPLGTDQVKFGDDHIRLIKSVLKLDLAFLWQFNRLYSFQAGNVVTINDALYDEVSGRFFHWEGTYSSGTYTVAPGSTPTTAGGVGEGKWVDKGTMDLKALYASELGAGLIGTSTGRTVQEELNKVFGPSVLDVSDFSSLKAAIAALPDGGGVITVPPDGNFYTGDWDYNVNYMSDPNISIIGKKRPSWNGDASALENGSILQGRFNVFANNFCVENIGFDLGKNVMAARYPGFDSLSNNHPLGGTWDAFAFAQPDQGSPLAGRRGCRFKNVIGLLKQSLTVGHAVLIEGVNGGSADELTGIYGAHGVVIKSQNMDIGSLQGYMASSNNVIVKSDTYAPAGDLQIGAVLGQRNLPNCTPHSAPVIATNGVLFNPATADFSGPIQVSNIKSFGATKGVIGEGGGSSRNIVDIQLGSVSVDGFTGTMDWGVIFGTTGQPLRVTIGDVICNNVVNGVYLNKSSATDKEQPQSTMKSLKVTNCTAQAVTVLGHARLTADVVELGNCGSAYYIDDTAALYVGTEKLNNVTNKWARGAIPLAANWVNFGSGNSSFDIQLKNYGVEIQGLVKANAGAGAVVFTVPAYLRPTETRRELIYKNTGTRGFALGGLDAATGQFILDDGTAPATGNYISLDGYRWKNKA